MKKAALALAAVLIASCASAPPPPPPPPAAPAGPGPDILVARARVLRAEGDIPGARSRLESALKDAPTDDTVRLELADLLVTQGEDLDRADDLLLPVAEGDGRIHLVRARIAEARKYDALAASEYRRYLERYDDPEVRLSHALALERLGKDPEVIEELERVKVVHPTDSIVRAHLAERYEAVRRMADAEAEYRFLTELNPGRASEWERLAGFYDRAGRPKDAKLARERSKGLEKRSDRLLRPLLPSRN